MPCHLFVAKKGEKALLMLEIREKKIKKNTTQSRAKKIAGERMYIVVFIVSQRVPNESRKTRERNAQATKHIHVYTNKTATAK